MRPGQRSFGAQSKQANAQNHRDRAGNVDFMVELDAVSGAFCCSGAEMSELEEKLEAAIEVTEEGNEVLSQESGNEALIERRKAAVVNLRGRLNLIRGFDAIAMGC